MSFLSISNIIFLQLILEIFLFFILLLIWRRTNNKKQQSQAKLPDDFSASIERFLAEAEKISKTFADNLQDKKELSADLILKLDRRLSEYQALLKLTEASLAAAQKKTAELKKTGLSNSPIPAVANGLKANPAAPEVRALVLQMAKKGCSPEEIASKARLRLGEVELIVDLERQFNI